LPVPPFTLIAYIPFEFLFLPFFFPFSPLYSQQQSSFSPSPVAAEGYFPMKNPWLFTSEKVEKIRNQSIKVGVRFLLDHCDHVLIEAWLGRLQQNKIIIKIIQLEISSAIKRICQQMAICTV
jgi:hypothetical protein